MEDNVLKVKFGSDEMVFWKEVIDGKTIDVEVTERNLKLFKAILEMAKQEYDKAEKEFNNKK